MTTVIVLLIVWIVAYVALLVWSLANKGRLVIGGFALISLSTLPMILGRWTTPSDWHDSPLMALYYVPSIIAFISSSIVFVVGLVVSARRKLLSRGGA